MTSNTKLEISNLKNILISLESLILVLHKKHIVRWHNKMLRKHIGSLRKIENIFKKNKEKDQILQMTQKVTESAKNCCKEYKKVQSMSILIKQYISQNKQTKWSGQLWFERNQHSKKVANTNRISRLKLQST